MVDKKLIFSVLPCVILAGDNKKKPLQFAEAF
jgi:hypothetical protein